MNAPNAKTVRILVVEDHPLVRKGLAALLEAEPDFEVCGEAEGAAEAIEHIESARPDLVIVDLSLQEGSGIELIGQIRARAKSVKILVSSMHDEQIFAERALQAGALGYVNKQEATETLVAAVRQVLAGKVYLSPAMADRVLTQLVDRGAAEDAHPVRRLSNRELQVFELLGRGQGTRQIAEQLHLSIKTVETHRESIKRKLKLETAGELTRAAVQWMLEQS